MTTILGIDAAWTATQPGGVALVSSAAGNWCLIFAGSSYRHLLDHADEGLISTSRPSGSVAEAAALLAAAGKSLELLSTSLPWICPFLLSRSPRGEFRTIWFRLPMAPGIAARTRRVRSGPARSATI